MAQAIARKPHAALGRRKLTFDRAQTDADKTSHTFISNEYCDSGQTVYKPSTASTAASGRAIRIGKTSNPT